MARKTQYPRSVKAGIPQEPKASEGWQLVPLSRVIQVVERPAELQDDQEYQLVTAKRSRGGIVPREKLLGKEILTKTQFYISAGDFLISKRQIIHGACGLVPPKLDGAIVSNEYSTLRTTSELLKEYLAYLSHTTYFQQTCFQASVGVDVEKMIFKLEDWLKYRIPLPPLKEQKRIADILSSVDEAIASTQAVIDQTRKVKQGLLQQLLTRGIGHEKFKETAIGLIPESWEVASIGQICEVTSGGTPDRSNLKFWNGSIPWVKTGEINYLEITDTEEKITEEGLENSSAKLVPPGTLLMAMYGQGVTRGKVAILGIEATINQACLAILPSSRISNHFLFYFFTHEYDNLRNLGNETTQKNLNAGLIKQIQVPVPSLDEQQKIIQSLTTVDSSLQSSQVKLQHYEVLKQGLMQDLLAGRVRVAV
jgi:type I restriction enzyme S subunit